MGGSNSGFSHGLFHQGCSLRQVPGVRERLAAARCIQGMLRSALQEAVHQGVHVPLAAVERLRHRLGLPGPQW